MIALEDTFADIIGKAQRGLGLSDTQLAEKARVNSKTVRKLRAGEFDELTVLRIAPVLGLAARALCELETGSWRPPKMEEIEGLAQFATRYHDTAVNSYLVWDPSSREAAAVDTGADCAGILKLATKENLSINLILLTHAHSDHVADLPRLREETGAEVFAPERAPVPGAETIDAGKRFRVGKIDIEARLTWGHSPGGMTFVATGLARPVAIVGDSLFAGSVGGGALSFKAPLPNNLEQILPLHDAPIICPRRGPLTARAQREKPND